MQQGAVENYRYANIYKYVRICPVHMVAEYTNQRYAMGDLKNTWKFSVLYGTRNCYCLFVIPCLFTCSFVQHRVRSATHHIVEDKSDVKIVNKAFLKSKSLFSDSAFKTLYVDYRDWDLRALDYSASTTGLRSSTNSPTGTRVRNALCIKQEGYIGNMYTWPWLRSQQ